MVLKFISFFLDGLFVTKAQAQLDRVGLGQLKTQQSLLFFKWAGHMAGPKWVQPVYVIWSLPHPIDHVNYRLL
jgi:hypothetical protein